MKREKNIEHELDTLTPRLEQNYLNAKTAILFINYLHKREKFLNTFIPENTNELNNLNEKINEIENKLKDTDKEIKEYIKEKEELEENYKIKCKEYELELEENKKLLNELKTFEGEDKSILKASAIKNFLDCLIKETDLEQENFNRDNFISELKIELEEINISNIELEEEMKLLRQNQEKLNEEIRNRGFTRQIEWIKNLLKYYKEFWGIELIGVYKSNNGFILHVVFDTLHCKLIFKDKQFESIEFPNGEKNYSINLLLRICKKINMPEVLLYCLSVAIY